MPLQLPKVPFEQTFPLASDPTGETNVTIRQATQYGHELRETLFSEASRIVRNAGQIGGGQEIELKQRLSGSEIARKEVFLTLVGSNVQDENGQPLFRFGLDGSSRQVLLDDEATFALKFGRLPHAWANEIHSFVGEVNPDWAIPGPNAKAP